jgi:hypothetical protein
MTAPIRTARCGKSEAKSRLAVAQAYLEAAHMIFKEQDRDAHLSVATGNAVLAGIAASDSICCTRLSKMHRGPDHTGAADLLVTAVSDGKRLSQMLVRLLDLKDEAHYGVAMSSSRRARDSVKWATILITRAREELER